MGKSDDQRGETAEGFLGREPAVARLARLQAVTSSLSAALTPSHVADAVFDHALREMDACGASLVYAVEPGRLKILHDTGIGAEARRALGEFSESDPLPSADAFRTGEAIWLGSPAEIQARYPQWEKYRAAQGAQAWAAVPLIVGVRKIGTLGLIFSSVRAFDPDERAFIRTVAEQCAQALERARLYEAARDAERQAKESEQRYRALFNNMSEGFALCEVVELGDGAAPDYRYLEVNPAYEALTGRVRAQLIGKLRSETDLGQQIEAARFVEVARTGRPAQFDVFHAGIARNFSLSVFSPLPGHFAILFTDITAQKHSEETHRQSVAERKNAQELLERANQKLSEILDSIQDDFYVLDRDWRFVFASRRFTSRVGKEPKDFVGHRLWDMFPKHLGTGLEENFRAAMEKRETRRFEVGGQYTEAWYLMHAFPSAEGITVLGTEVTDRKRAEEQLHQQAGALKTAVERAERNAVEADAVLSSLHDVLLIYDNEANVRRANPVFSTIFGFDPTGLNVRDVIRRVKCRRVDGRPLVPSEGPTPKALRGEPVVGAQYIVTRSNGDEMVVETSSKTLFSGDHVIGSVTAWHDITERMKAEEGLRASERLYRAIGESIDYGVWICAPDGRNTYASESFLKLVGLTQEQCSNFGWGDVLHPDDAERTLGAWKECTKTGGNWDVEHRYRGVDGQWHPILARGVPVRNEEGQIVAWAGINLDISRLKQTETLLRTREAALEEADRRKDEFLAMLSHELRNPLAAISNAQSVLERSDSQDPRVLRMRAVIGRQVRHLSRLVDDLLDVARITQGKIALKRERTLLAGCVEQAVATCRPQLDAAGHNFVLALHSESLWLDADPARIEQIVGNVLSNAIRYTDPGGRIRLALEAEDGQAVIRLRDDGSGIDPALLPRIFEPFTQADTSVARSKGGLGLGLALVRSLVELHGGSVTALSEGPGKGTEIVVRLPLAANQPASAQAAGAGVVDGPHLKILFVDDNRDAADSLADLTGLWGHDARSVHDGAAALEAAVSWRPHIVLLDIGMPGMDGYEVARRMRQMSELAGMKIVALTGYGDEQARKQVRAAGFDGHLIKPVGARELEAAIADAGKGERA